MTETGGELAALKALFEGIDDAPAVIEELNPVQVVPADSELATLITGWLAALGPDRPTFH